MQKETFQTNGGKPLDCEVLHGGGNPQDCRKARAFRISASCAHEGETVGKSEERDRFYNLKRLVVETETLMCAWAQVCANRGAPGGGGVTVEDIAQSEGGVEAFVAVRTSKRT